MLSTEAGHYLHLMLETGRFFRYLIFNKISVTELSGEQHETNFNGIKNHNRSIHISYRHPNFCYTDNKAEAVNLGL
jgi:hypothetical protein